MARLPTLKPCLWSGLRPMPDGTIEIITGRERRRRWSVTDKLRIVAEAEQTGARISEVAARHDIYPSLLFYWRRQVREGRLVDAAAPEFVPVRLAAAAAEASRPQPGMAMVGTASGAGLEIILPDGIRLSIKSAVQLPLLRGVLGVLRG